MASDDPGGTGFDDWGGRIAAARAGDAPTRDELMEAIERWAIGALKAGTEEERREIAVEFADRLTREACAHLKADLRPPELTPYLHAAMRNFLLNRKREMHFEHVEIHLSELSEESRALLEETIAGHEPDPLQAALSHETADEIRRAVARLSLSDRQLYELKWAEELDNDEIAQRLGIAPASIRQRLHRLRERIRSKMDDSSE